jgi:hypothetical protein
MPHDDLSLVITACNFPSRETTTADTLLRCPSIFFNITPLFKFHRRSVLSREPVTIRCPSEKTAIASTEFSCSSSVQTSVMHSCLVRCAALLHQENVIQVEVDGVQGGQARCRTLFCFKLHKSVNVYPAIQYLETKRELLIPVDTGPISHQVQPSGFQNHRSV